MQFRKRGAQWNLAWPFGRWRLTSAQCGDKDVRIGLATPWMRWTSRLNTVVAAEGVKMSLATEGLESRPAEAATGAGRGRGGGEEEENGSQVGQATTNEGRQF